MSYNKVNLIVVLGPTATGKTSVAVKIAEKFNGEIISADSRQIYRGMDIGTGKDLDEYSVDGNKISYHLIDIINPSEDYSVFHFQKDFYFAYDDIVSRNKVPILCGGTGLYIESILLNYEMKEVAPDFDFRQKLEQKSLTELVKQLKNLNPKLHNTTDLTTKKRVIRAIEIAVASTDESFLDEKKKIVKPMVLGVNYPRETVRKRITERLHTRMENGMIEEVETVMKSGISLERLHYFGLEYRFISQFLKGELRKEEMVNKMNIAIHQFSKRQMTFFRRMEKRGVKIHWIENCDLENAMSILKFNEK